jgi:DNA-binding beta-propeller fold protein YncE
VKITGRCAAVLAAAVIATTALPALAAVVSYAPPSGTLPAGSYHGVPFQAILPSGRLVTPAGASVITGVGGRGLAQTPDGRFLIVGNDDGGDGGIHSALDLSASDGPSLAVVDAATMTIVSRFQPLPGERYGGGVLAVRDPANPGGTLVLAAGGGTDAVYAFTLDAFGRLVADARHRIAIPGPQEPAFANFGHSDPTAFAASPDGSRAYVVTHGGGALVALDLATRRVLGPPRPVGFFPSSAAVAGGRVFVTNEGMMRYGIAVARTAVPPFGVPPAALARASSLSLVDLSLGGGLVPPPPETTGGDAVPMDPPADGLRIVGGAHPSAVIATPNGRYAFVAMTNVDRIATVALEGPARVVGGTELRLFDKGPYGTQPLALAQSRDGSRLYVALRGLDAVAVIDARDPVHLHRLGLIPTGWAPCALALGADDRTLFVLNNRGFGPENALWSTLQRIDLAGVKLASSTRAALAATRVVASSPIAYPKALRTVIVIAIDHTSYDAAFALGAKAPNLQALAARYTLAANFYGEPTAALAHQTLVAGDATAYAATRADVHGSPFGAADDPEDAPRIGTIFNALARRNLGYRDYGAFLAVAGFDGSSYAYDVPASAVLAGHVDLDYPAGAPATDAQRADAFIRDYDQHAAGGAALRYAFVWLPGARLGDTDAAVGAIVEHLSHLWDWRATAVVVVAGDAGTAPDRLDPAHTFALVVGPTAKRHYVTQRHLSSASVLKTVDELVGVPPLGLGDLLASDLSDCFTSAADVGPYTAILGSP